MMQAQQIAVSSNALMSNSMTTATIFLNNENQIRFFLGGNSIVADCDNVVSTQNCTVLGNQAIKVALIEHFMATLAFLNIKGVDVCLDNFEMPILDGSSKVWVEKLSSLKQEKNSQNYTIDEPIYFRNDKTEIIILPSEKFELSYLVDFNHPDLKQRWVNLDYEKLQDIIEARTFGYLADLEKLQAMGLAQGVSLENTLGLKDDGGYTSELRSEFEPAKHKMLDLIGDFYLSGINPFNMNIRVIAKQAGHATHVEVAKILKQKLREV